MTDPRSCFIVFGVTGRTKKEKEPTFQSLFFLPFPQCTCHSGPIVSQTCGFRASDTIMIREKSLFCKLIHIKSSSKSLFDSFMDGFRPELRTCPCCCAKGYCHIHAYYGRFIVDFINGKPVRHDLCILRLVCSCGHTHAILPDFIIPYSGYGLFFILRVLAEHFAGLYTVERICERFSITRRQFCRWLFLWHAHKKEWLGALSSMETTDRSFMKGILSDPCCSDLTSEFVRRFSVSFLQSHKNPAHYCQQAFVP